MTTQQVYNTLQLEFPYFKKLNLAKRALFCKRVVEFIKHTRFVGKQKLEVSNKMKILIAACSQQLTLSFKKNYLYDHFDRIFIYPTKYLSTVTNSYHVGEMNTAGLLIFSWEDFYQGIKVENDNRNVGLHEFAHALEFIDIANKPTDDRFSFALDKEYMVAHDFIKTRSEEQFFRNYAMTNRAEFFAVATEYFFESPEDFYAAHPVTYELFCKIYGQDMREKTITFKPFISDTNIALGRLWLNYYDFKFYDLGVEIHFSWVYGYLKKLFTGKKVDLIQRISYNDIFSGNVSGDLNYKNTFMGDDKQNMPLLTLRYYKAGKIKSEIISLVKFEERMNFLFDLSVHKKICIRIDGQIKRFD
jgi:MtfA peptidase